MTSQGITACLFDLDGTLIDSEHVWTDAICNALASRGVNLPREAVARIEYGRAWVEIYATIDRMYPGLFKNIGDMERLTGAFYDEYTASNDIAISPSVELLERLHAGGYAIAIVSGSVKSRIAAAVKDLGIEGLLSACIGSGDYTHGKPAPDSYLAAAAKLGLRPAQCLAFEDSPAGIQSAKAAGMKCVVLKRPSPVETDYGIADLALERLSDFRMEMLDQT